MHGRRGQQRISRNVDVHQTEASLEKGRPRQRLLIASHGEPESPVPRRRNHNRLTDLRGRKGAREAGVFYWPSERSNVPTGSSFLGSSVYRFFGSAASSLLA